MVTQDPSLPRNRLCRDGRQVPCVISERCLPWEAGDEIGGEADDSEIAVVDRNVVEPVGEKLVSKGWT